MPYLYNLAIDANQFGHPVQRAMLLEFPDDRTTHFLERQYMIGPSLLVAPVFEPLGTETEYYIPAGRWTSFFHPDRSVVGPTWIKEHVPLEDIPVWVRPGSILCLGPPGTDRPDYNFMQDVEVRIYQLGDEQSSATTIPVGKGSAVGGAVSAIRKGSNVQVRVSDALKDALTIKLISNSPDLEYLVSS
jgi:alpha-glucosidase (family GH31 glycosyl hydrolase)